MKKITVIFALIVSFSFLSADTTFAPFTPPPDTMHITQSIDPVARLALNRINQYRKAAGLEAWEYDPSLSRMAMAHASYMVTNCVGKRAYNGHFENPSFPGYSKEGDEAARTSGLSGGPDILDAYERLMAAVYHRVQFTKPGKDRVGFGYAKSSDGRCSGGLFVNRPGGFRWKYKEPRFILFPPDGFNDALTSFESEWPDPIPVANHGRTGYIISIQLHYLDRQMFKSSAARLTDEMGNRVDCWISDPANPSVKSIDVSGKYAPGKGISGNPFASNFDMVFIMPKKPLVPGMKYLVSAELIIGEETHNLNWSFRVRKNTQWTVSNTSRLPENGLSFVLAHAQDGDRISFSEPHYQLPLRTIWVSRPLTITAGKGNHVLASAVSKESMIAAQKNVALTIENIEIQASSSMFYLKDGASITFRNCKIKNLSKGFFASLSAGSTYIFENCDFTDFKGPWFVFFHDPSAKIIMKGKNRGDLQSLRKHSRGTQGITFIE